MYKRAFCITFIYLDINKSDIFFCFYPLKFFFSQTHRSKGSLTCRNYDANLNKSSFVEKDPISGTPQCCQRCNINLTRDKIIFWWTCHFVRKSDRWNLYPQGKMNFYQRFEINLIKISWGVNENTVNGVILTQQCF